MLGTPVPKATVDKYREVGSREDDVGANRSAGRRYPNRVVNSKAKA